MARTNTYTCATCGTTYEFCLRCQVIAPDYDATKFCSKKHGEIYAILSKHGCNLISAEEALKELSAYNLDEITLTEDILTHINAIKAEIGLSPVAEEKVNVEETVVVEEVAPAAEKPATQYNKNKKKKW